MRILQIEKCGDCPHKSSTANFKGQDTWTCKRAEKVIAVDIEWKSEEPKKVPEWCPLESPK